MANIIISPKQLNTLLETGSNSAAMDVDRYTQSIDHPTGNENEDILEATRDIINNLKEVVYMVKAGKQIEKTKQMEFFRLLDNVKKLVSKIKEV